MLSVCIIKVGYPLARPAGYNKCALVAVLKVVHGKAASVERAFVGAKDRLGLSLKTVGTGSIRCGCSGYRLGVRAVGQNDGVFSLKGSSAGLSPIPWGLDMVVLVKYITQSKAA